MKRNFVSKSACENHHRACLVLTAWEKDSEEEEKNDHIKNTLSFEKRDNENRCVAENEIKSNNNEERRRLAIQGNWWGNCGQRGGTVQRTGAGEKRRMSNNRGPRKGPSRKKTGVEKMRQAEMRG